MMLENIPSGYPVANKGVSASYGWRMHPVLKKKEFHKGIDLRGKSGTPIYATANGVVEYASFHKKSGYGNLVIMVNNYGFKTLYGHLSKIKVKSLQILKKGDLIGYVGSTGMSTGPHLHYEVRFMQRSLEPARFLKWSEQNFETIFEKERRVPWQSLTSLILNQKK
jgi:murein DD-endopeptidase MepM/ murein hydrolase activator NlpD